MTAATTILGIFACVFDFYCLFAVRLSRQLVAHADNRVLVIGIDGAGGGFLENANTPYIDALISDGGVRYDFLNEAARSQSAVRLRAERH